MQNGSNAAYNAPQPPYRQQMKPKKDKPIAALVLGVVALFSVTRPVFVSLGQVSFNILRVSFNISPIIGFICGLIGTILGARAMRQIGDPLSKSGFILSLVAMILCAAFFVLGVVARVGFMGLGRSFTQYFV